MSGPGSHDETGPGEAPQLLEPAPLAQTQYQGAAVAAGLSLAVMAMLAATAYWGLPGGQSRQAAGEIANQIAVKLSPSDVPGAVGTIDKALTAHSQHVFTALVMPQDEKARLKRELEGSAMRIGRLTVWDTVDEDDDRVRISASGFSQDVVIGHAPKSFFVPYLPGTAVQVLALQDGGGGGVTLGVSTTLGPVSLPHIAPGQIIEIAVP